MVTSDHWAGCDRIVAAGPHVVYLVPDRKCAVPSYLLESALCTFFIGKNALRQREKTVNLEQLILFGKASW
jgi:hypothetical protein